MLKISQKDRPRVLDVLTDERNAMHGPWSRLNETLTKDAARKGVSTENEQCGTAEARARHVFFQAAIALADGLMEKIKTAVPNTEGIIEIDV